MIRRPPRSTLFPYTPLSRSRSYSHLRTLSSSHSDITDRYGGGAQTGRGSLTKPPSCSRGRSDEEKGEAKGQLAPRSEEHTSELQSRQYIACRLLLEKKNFRTATPTSTCTPPSCTSLTSCVPAPPPASPNLLTISRLHGSTRICRSPSA